MRHEEPESAQRGRGKLDAAPLVRRRANAYNRLVPEAPLKEISMKPVINLDEAEFDDIEENGLYTSKRATIGAHIGAKKLGYNLTVLPPGKAQCPFHSHRGEEEMFFIIEGEGELRFGDKRYPLRAHDVVACPCGGPEVAHQIINTGQTTMRYLSLSNIVDVEICEYPDGGKLGAYADPIEGPRLRKLFRAETNVDYYDREKT
jgi:uncharacterized cupin superfamily protein